MRWTLCGLLVLVAACWNQGEEPPGEPVGTFEAVGLMVEQSCGSAIPAADPLNLRFELRREDGGRAYWRQLGGPIFAGVYRDDKYSFPVSQSWMVIEPDRFHGYVGCSVTQRDEFTFVVEVPEIETEGDAGVEEEPEADAGAVDAGVDPVLITLSGSQTTEIEPLAGADCTPAVAALGGPFLSLPCRVEYVLTGNGVAVE
jgi:hypothetical protein